MDNDLKTEASPVACKYPVAKPLSCHGFNMRSA